MSADLGFDKIVYFGDSLTDTGTFYNRSGDLLWIPAPFDDAGYTGKFSNGDLYSQIAPELLGVTEGKNYAVASARATGSRDMGDVINDNGLWPLLKVFPWDNRLDWEINLNAQVDRFIDRETGDLSTTAASIFIGVNDYADFKPSSPDAAEAEAYALMDKVVNKTLKAAEDLAAEGVGTIIINTLPPGAFFPYFETVDPEIQAISGEVIEANNEALRSGAAELEATGVTVYVVEMEALAEEIIADPSTFGFVAPLTEYEILSPGPFSVQTNPALDGLDEDQFAFWDIYHPTAATQGVMGVFSAESLTSEVFLLGDAADTITTSKGDDLVFSSSGDDELSTRGGLDVVFAGLGNDRVSAGRQADIVSGGSGNDRLRGAAGHDVVAGGDGNDRVMGGDGRDVLIDGLGSDSAFGNAGDDVFLYTEAALIGGTTGADQDVFTGGNGTDTLYLALTDETRAAVEAEMVAGPDQQLDSIGLTTSSIEEIVFVDSRLDLASVETNARLEEADLWGLV